MDAVETTAVAGFEFGANWQRFLNVLDDRRVTQAEAGLREMLEVDTLAGKTFLDVGSGSGLSSLAARRLGARVRSFDVDPQSVACTRLLKDRYFPDDDQWTVEHGTALDTEYLRALGCYDIVYSWGVLHHTGSMWQALANVAPLVAPGGRLFLSIYNDQGNTTRRWARIKRNYNRLPRPLRFLILMPCFFHLWGRNFLVNTLKGNPLRDWQQYGRERGMSPWHDVVDWVGGYPFEAASVDEIFHFYRDWGFSLRRIKTRIGRGCNEFVLEKAASAT